MWYVYLLLSEKDGDKYIGSTNNVVRRLKQHNEGNVLSTRFRLPMILIGYQEFRKVEDASAYEKKYKRSHGALDRSIKRGDFKIISNGV